jgi:hypothetical protein
MNKISALPWKDIAKTLAYLGLVAGAAHSGKSIYEGAKEYKDTGDLKPLGWGLGEASLVGLSGTAGPLLASVGQASKLVDWLGHPNVGRRLRKLVQMGDLAAESNASWPSRFGLAGVSGLGDAAVLSYGITHGKTANPLEAIDLVSNEKSSAFWPMAKKVGGISFLGLLNAMVALGLYSGGRTMGHGTEDIMKGDTSKGLKEVAGGGLEAGLSGAFLGAAGTSASVTGNLMRRLGVGQKAYQTVNKAHRLGRSAPWLPWLTSTGVGAAGLAGDISTYGLAQKLSEPEESNNSQYAWEAEV